MALFDCSWWVRAPDVKKNRIAISKLDIHSYPPRNAQRRGSRKRELSPFFFLTAGRAGFWRVVGWNARVRHHQKHHTQRGRRSHAEAGRRWST